MKCYLTSSNMCPLTNRDQSDARSSSKTCRVLRYDFHYVLSYVLRHVWAGTFVWAMIANLIASTAAAQNRTSARNLGAPSPAEMLVRLQYRRQQETPLFDLLRGSGRDIFSKLGDDERKFAERFAEDLIQNRGLESEEVQELMKQMNVEPRVQKAISESLKGADSNQFKSNRGTEKSSEPNINLDRLKRRLENVRQQQLLDRLSSNDPMRSETLGASRTTADAGSQPKTRDRSGRTSNANNYDSTSRPNGASQRNSNEPNGESNMASPAKNNSTNNGNNRSPTSGDAKRRSVNRNRANDSLPKLRLPGETPRDFKNQFPGNGPFQGRQAKAKSEVGQADRVSDSSSLLNSRQRAVVEKLKRGIEPNSSSGRATRKGLERIKQAKDPTEFLDRLKKLSKQVKADSQKKQLLQKSAQSLSKADESMIRSFVEPFSPDLARSMRASDSKSAEATGAKTSSGGAAGKELTTANPEDWAQSEFLKQAINYYNDKDSGFQKPKGFDRLLNDKASRSSGATMNFEAAKKLWKQGANIFNDRIDNTGDSKKIKPGQRIDQSVIEAIKKVSADSSKAAAGQNSVFTNALNGLIGTAMDKAEETAKDRVQRGRNRQNAGLAGNSSGQPRKARPNSNSSSNSISQTLQNLTNPSANDSQANSSSPSASPTLPTLQNVRSIIVPIMYALICISLLALVLYLVFRFLKPVDKIALQQKKLQEKLRSTGTSKPSDIVAAVDLLLLTKFGTAASWWNSHRAAERLQAAKPGWHEKIGSVFQLYRWSRYHASSKSAIPAEQETAVTEVLKELASEPKSIFHPPAKGKTALGVIESDAVLEFSTPRSRTADKASS